jgi:hypothetical protein
VTPSVRRLGAALAAVLVQAEAPELALVHRWLDNWHGAGLLTVGLHCTGYDLDLRHGSLTRSSDHAIVEDLSRVRRVGNAMKWPLRALWL